MDELRLYNELLADLNKATELWLKDFSTCENANAHKAKTLFAAGWTKPLVAQQVEPAAHEGLVAGSSPAGRTILELAEKLRSTTKQMANCSATPMGLWDEHSRACLEAVSVLSAQYPPSEPVPAVQEQGLDSTALEMAALEIVELYRGDGGFCGLKAAEEQARRTLRAYFAALRTQGGE